MTPSLLRFCNRASAVLALLMLLFCFTPMLPGGASAEALTVREDEDDMRGLFSPRVDPPYTLDFSNITVRITISEDEAHRVEEIQLKLYGDYYFENDMRCICDESDDSYTLSIVNNGGVISAYDFYGDLLVRGDELRLNKVYVSRHAGYATLFTAGCDRPDYPYGTNGCNYQGNFVFDAKDDGHLRMLNIVPLKYYTYGVIEHEVNYAILPAALRTQAIAAKSFGLSFWRRYGDYDVMDGFTDYMNQMYRGYQLNANKLTMLDACDYVHGKAIAFNGNIIPACYGATNGGETTLPYIIFGQGQSSYDYAYDIAIDSADFQYATSYRKNVNLVYGSQDNVSYNEQTSRFLDFILVKARAQLGGNYNKVTEIISVQAFDPVPRTTRDMKQLSFTAKVIDTNYVPDPTATPDPEDPGPTPEPTPVPEPVPVTFTCTCPISELKSLHLSDLDGSGNSYPSNKAGVFFGSYKMYWGEATSGGYNLYFCRHGNGIGLSQVGAEAMARPEYGSKTYEQIVGFYYPHFEIVDIIEDDPDEPFACTLTPVAYGHCTGANVNVRTAPSLTDSSVIGIAHTDEHLDIISVADDGSFYQVLWNGHMGYISVKFTSIDFFAAPDDAEFTLYSGVCETDAELYTAPTVQANAYAVLDEGSEVTVWASIGNWYYVVGENGKAGYLPNTSVTLTGSYQYHGSEPIQNLAPKPRFIVSLGREDIKPVTGRRRIG